MTTVSITLKLVTANFAGTIETRQPIGSLVWNQVKNIVQIKLKLNNKNVVPILRNINTVLKLTQSFYTTDTVISPNTWTHVAGTYDAHTGFSKIFIDGHLNGESQGSGLLSQDWDHHAGIGSHKDSRFLDGQVDEFRIYNYAMGEDDIRKVMKTCNYDKGK